MKRIHRSKDKEEIIGLLMSDQLGVFKEIWRLLLFSAHVGINSNRREPLKSIDTGKGIDQSTFGNCPSWPGVCYLIALVEKGSSEIIGGSESSEEERLNVFQEYANGGLAILEEFFGTKSTDLNSLLTFIQSQKELGKAAINLDLSI